MRRCYVVLGLVYVMSILSLSLLVCQSASARDWPVLIIGMESDRGTDDPDYEHGGAFDPSAVEEVLELPAWTTRRVFRPEVRTLLFGDSYPSLTVFFHENSGGALNVTCAGILGPYKKKYTEVVYRDRPNCFYEMVREAWGRADQDFDFAPYDTNHDGEVVAEELAIVVVFSGGTEPGSGESWGNIGDIVTNDCIDPLCAFSPRVVLDGSNGCHGYTPLFNDTAADLIAHELAHVMIHAPDMYEAWLSRPWPGHPGPFSLMDHTQRLVHLDPYCKIVSGKWFSPWVMTNEDQYVDISSVEHAADSPGPFFLKLAASTTAKEYFLVEKRSQIGCDTNLPDAGIAIWHVDETRVFRSGTEPVEIEPACGFTNAGQWQNYLWDGTGTTWGEAWWDRSMPTNSKYNDGTSSGFGVFAIPASTNEPARLYIDTPGPGVLVQVRPRPWSMWEPITTSLEYQVRLMNTGPRTDTFLLNVSYRGDCTVCQTPKEVWGERYVSLAPYEERVVTLRLDDPWVLSDPLVFDVIAEGSDAVTHWTVTATRGP